MKSFRWTRWWLLDPFTIKYEQLFKTLKHGAVFVIPWCFVMMFIIFVWFMWFDAVIMFCICPVCARLKKKPIKWWKLKWCLNLNMVHQRTPGGCSGSFGFRILWSPESKVSETSIPESNGNGFVYFRVYVLKTIFLSWIFCKQFDSNLGMRS